MLLIEVPVSAARIPLLLGVSLSEQPSASPPSPFYQPSIAPCRCSSLSKSHPMTGCKEQDISVCPSDQEGNSRNVRARHATSLHNLDLHCRTCFLFFHLRRLLRNQHESAGQGDHPPLWDGAGRIVVLVKLQRNATSTSRL
ncbi:hypothetical protein BDZ89DRAFT_539310 [Hymenopellis radicata]|nr:hypothetical protein BDZ89DRAFT_539310 [Hymenopellis radicata]